MNTEKLEKLPDSVLTDITDKPSETPATSETPGITAVSQDELNKAKTEVKADLPTGQPGMPIEGDKAVKPAENPFGYVPGPTTGMSVVSFLPSPLAIHLLDTLVPFLIVLLIEQFGYRIGVKSLQLTATEKKLLEQPTHEMLDSLKINFKNPIYNFLFALCAVYAAKTIELIPEIKKIDAAKKEESDLTPGDKAIKEAEEKLNKQEQKKAEEKKFIDSLRKANAGVAIKMIMDKRKLGRQDATDFYHKKISQK